MPTRLPICTAPRDGTLIRFWCRSGPAPIVGYWSSSFFGWCSYTERIPLIRHDVTGWEPIADQAAARVLPLEKPRRRTPAPIVVLGTAIATPAALPGQRRPSLATVVVGKAPAAALRPHRRVPKPTMILGL
jgi:hypothetical protein